MNRLVWIVCLLLSLRSISRADDALDFITPPIEFTGGALGVCTGDRFDQFRDAKGKHFMIATQHTRTLDESKPAIVHTLDPVLLIIHGNDTITAPDGGKLQLRLLELISDAASAIKYGSDLNEDKKGRLKNLESLIDDLKSRQVNAKPGQ